MKVKYDVYRRHKETPSDSFVLDTDNRERLYIEGNFAVVRKDLYIVIAVYSDFTSIQRAD